MTTSNKHCKYFGLTDNQTCKTKQWDTIFADLLYLTVWVIVLTGDKAAVKQYFQTWLVEVKIMQSVKKNKIQLSKF